MNKSIRSNWTHHCLPTMHCPSLQNPLWPHHLSDKIQTKPLLCPGRLSTADIAAIPLYLCSQWLRPKSSFYSTDTRDEQQSHRDLTLENIHHKSNLKNLNCQSNSGSQRSQFSRVFISSWNVLLKCLQILLDL